MGKSINWSLELSKKSEEELFNIYTGHPKHLPKRIRYQAGRILENRDFQFDQVPEYKETWEEQKLRERSTALSTFFSSFASFLQNSTDEIREKKKIVELSH